jgi:rod shape-determining protein MreD
MKKAFSILISFVVFLLVYFLQSNFFNWFTIYSVKPNLFVILILCMGLFGGKVVGTAAGVIYGLIIDLFIGKSIGLSAIMLGMIGFAGGYLDKNFSKERRLNMMLMCIGTTFGYELGLYVLNILKYQMNIEILSFLKIIFIELIYNSMLIIIFYPLIQKLGLYMERTFKETKILTRYY